MRKPGIQIEKAGLPMIEVRDLVKKFGDFCAVNHISFTVERGKIFGFLGPNGAGKTTTIKILTTILHPTSGTIRVDGHDPVLEQREVRRAFGIVFQDPSLDDELTAVENLESARLFVQCRVRGTKEKDRRTAEVCRAMGPTKRLREALFRRYEAAARSRPRLLAPPQESYFSMNRRSGLILKREIISGAISSR